MYSVTFTIDNQIFLSHVDVVMIFEKKYKLLTKLDKLVDVSNCYDSSFKVR